MAGVPYCRDRAWSAGMLVQTLDQYRKDLRPAAQAELGLSTRPTVTLVANGGAAEAAGVRPRDVIAAIDGHVFAEGKVDAGKSFATAEAAHDAIEAALADGSATLDVIRDGQPLRIALVPRKACRVRFDVRPGTTSIWFNRFADAGTDYVLLQSELVGRAGSDDELAAVLAHEMSHIALRHPQRLRAKGERLKVRTTEIEADRLSVYLLDAAGYSPNAAIAFWTRWGAKTDLGILSDRTHPGWKKRVATIEAEAASIAAQRAAGRPVSLPADLQDPDATS